MPLVAALDRVAGVRAVLALFEGVCTGAADGYARLTDRPAMTLLHLGPGFANGIANLHNARRARSPIVNVIGDHATWHLAADAPLTSDIVSLANPVSGWVRSVRSAEDVAADTVAAIEASLAPPGQVATLIVPADCQWNEAAGAAASGAPCHARRRRERSHRARRARAAHRRRRRSSSAVSRCAARRCAPPRACAPRRTRGCCTTSSSRASSAAPICPRSSGCPTSPSRRSRRSRTCARLVLVGTRDPVSFFGYPNVPSRLAPEACERIELAAPDEDVVGALDALADALGAPREVPALPGAARPGVAERRARRRDARPGRRRATARGRDRGRRSGDLGRRLVRARGQRAAAHRARPHRRRDRPGATHGGRRGDRVSAAQGDRAAGRWIGHVHRAGALDDGARVARRGRRAVREPRLSDPAARSRARRDRRARAGRPWTHGTLESAPSIGARSPVAWACRLHVRRTPTPS